MEAVPLAIVACGACAAFLLVLSTIPAQSPMSARLKKMERVSATTVSGRVAMIEKIVSKERLSRLGRQLIEAGWYRVSPVAFVLRGFGSLGLGVVAGLAFLLIAGASPLSAITAVFAALLGWRIPGIVLARAIKARKEEVQRALPDFIDLLANTVKVGLALNSALTHAVEATQGSLKDELTSMLAEVRLGRPRSDAFIAMAERINEEATTTMVMAIVQAEKIGSNLSEVLTELARDVRDRRWLRAEERAAQLPIKMIVPMGLFMIPSLYLMIFGPVIARLVTHR